MVTGGHRRVRARRRDLRAARRARGAAHRAARPRQHGGDAAVDPAARRGRGPDPRVLRARRRRAVRRRSRASTRVWRRRATRPSSRGSSSRSCRSCPGSATALARGIDVLDVGCGSGRALNRLAAEFPRSRFTGCDLSRRGHRGGARRGARARARQRALRVRDAAELGLRGQFDLVTAFDAIHDQARPDAVLRAIAEQLRARRRVPDAGHRRDQPPGRGRAHPLAPFLYTISCLHCMTVSLAEGGTGLGAMWGAERAQQMLRERGLRPGRAAPPPARPDQSLLRRAQRDSRGAGSLGWPCAATWDVHAGCRR